MSDLLQGLEDIPDASDSLQVLFSIALEAAPEVVLVKVENTSAATDKLAITALVTQKSAAGFTVGLSQETNSSDYKLAWYVVDTATLIEIVIAQAGAGRRVTDLTVAPTMAPGDYFPVVRSSPTPTTRRLFWSTVLSAFLRWVTPRPLTGPGTFGDAFFADGALHVHDGGQWVTLAAQTQTPGPVVSQQTINGAYEWAPQKDGDALVLTLQGDSELTIEPPADVNSARRITLEVRQPAAGAYTLDVSGDVEPALLITPDASTSNFAHWQWTGASYKLTLFTALSASAFTYKATGLEP